MALWTRRQVAVWTLGLAGCGALTGCGLASFPGSQPAGPRRVGYLDSLANQGTIEPFRDGMRELGYVDGRTVAVEYRSADGDLALLPTLVAELVALPIDVFVAPNPIVARAAREATSTLPIVASGGNVVAAGLVTNIAHPEGNITGVTTNSVEAIGKWVELLKEAVPATTRLAVLLDLGGPAAQAFLSQVELATRALQLLSRPYDVRDLAQLPAVLATVKTDGMDGLVVVSGGALGGGSDPRISTAVFNSQIPAVAELRSFAVAGGLLSHGASTSVLARRSAGFVDKILHGARPSDLPIELPTVFDVVVNLNTAAHLGLTIPPSVLQRATEIIQ
jgi:putative tryptophan/tyrosine transport system substrate-binding protein